MKDNKKSSTAFLIAISQNIAFAAANVALSINKNMAELEYDILIYHSGLTEKDADTLSRIPNVKLRIFRFSENFLKTMLSNIPNQSRFKDLNSLMCFCHFEIFALLKEYHNVIWLDADVGVQMDISSIINYGPFGITEDTPWSVGNNFTQPIAGYDMNVAGYCTAVIAVNDTLPHEEIYDWCYEKSLEYSKFLVNPDQAIINIMLQEFAIPPTVMPLDQWQCISWKENAITAKIVHFGGKSKIWNNTNILSSFPEWYRTHLEWLKLGGSNFDTSHLLVKNAYSSLRKMDENKQIANHAIRRNDQSPDINHTLVVPVFGRKPHEDVVDLEIGITIDSFGDFSSKSLEVFVNDRKIGGGLLKKSKDKRSTCYVLMATFPASYTTLDKPLIIDISLDLVIVPLQSLLDATDNSSPRVGLRLFRHRKGDQFSDLTPILTIAEEVALPPEAEINAVFQIAAAQENWIDARQDFAEGSASYFLPGGWHDLEEWGVWGKGRQQTMILPLRETLEPHDEIILEMAITVLFSEKTPTRNIKITAGGSPIGDYKFERRDENKDIYYILSAMIPAHNVDVNNMLIIDIQIDSVIIPIQSYSDSSDSRSMGIGLRRFRYRRNDRPSDLMPAFRIAEEIQLPPETVAMEVFRIAEARENWIDTGSDFAAGSASYFLPKGWHSQESWGVWGNGRQHTMSLPLRQISGTGEWIILEAEIAVLFSDEISARKIRVAAAGVLIGEYDLRRSGHEKGLYYSLRATLPQLYANSHDTLTIDFYLDSVIVPVQAYSDSPDSRPMGMGLRRFRYQKSDQPLDLASLSIEPIQPL